jgi:dihydroorotase
MSLLIQNVVRLDAHEQLIPCEVRIVDARIVELGTTVKREVHDRIVDGQGALLTPGLVDIHVHLRDPGFTHKEDIHSGTQAAARGGYTTIVAMPNTQPVMDNAAEVDAFYRRVQAHACVDTYTYGAITQGLNSDQLCDHAALLKAGVLGFSNDGLGVQNAWTMGQAMQRAAQLDSVIVAHCEDDALKADGVVHDGRIAERLNLKPLAALSETVHIARDALLAEAHGARYHVCHLSSRASVQAVREAKARGVRISAEVTPHHLLLCEDDVLRADPNFKMNPPLRSKDDQEALLEGLLDNTIDCIACDHAPHSPEEKALGFERAPFGIVGLEYNFALLYTHLVKTQKLSLAQLLRWLTLAPAAVMRLPEPRLDVGARANLALFDLNRSKSIEPPFASKSRNSPFIGWRVQGFCRMCVVNGKVVFEDAT